FALLELRRFFRRELAGFNTLLDALFLIGLALVDVGRCSLRERAAGECERDGGRDYFCVEHVVSPLFLSGMRFVARTPLQTPLARAELTVVRRSFVANCVPP